MEPYSDFSLVNGCIMLKGRQEAADQRMFWRRNGGVHRTVFRVDTITQVKIIDFLCSMLFRVDTVEVGGV